MTACMEAVMNAGSLAERGTGSFSTAPCEADRLMVRRRSTMVPMRMLRKMMPVIAKKSHGKGRVASWRGRASRKRGRGMAKNLAWENRTAGKRPGAEEGHKERSAAEKRTQGQLVAAG